MMNQFNLVIFIVFLCILSNKCKVLANCIDPNQISPCTGCELNFIDCSGSENINLQEIFHNLSQTLTDKQKHFERFKLNNTLITQLTANIFEDIIFDKIEIEGSALKFIHPDAFINTYNITKELEIINNAQLVNIKTDPNGHAYNFFDDVLNKFLNLEEFTLIADQSIYLPQYSFKHLNNLTKISLSSLTSIQLSNYTFAFEKNSTQKLFIDLKNDKLNESSFTNTTFADIHRPTEIDFGKINVKYLSEEIFLPFLSSYNSNIITMQGTKIDCQNCKTNWLKQNKSILPRVYNLTCTDGHYIDDMLSFDYCLDSTQLDCSFGSSKDIHCEQYNKALDLRQYFQTLSSKLKDDEKHFTKFDLVNIGMTELKAQTFQDITFDEIQIYAGDIRSIDPDAFAKTYNVTKVLYLSTGFNYQSNLTQLFDVLTRFVNIEKLDVVSAILEIPTRAFKQSHGQQNKLKQLGFEGYSIARIGSYAFEELDGLTSLYFQMNQIKHIEKYAFSFLRSSNLSIDINLSDHTMNNSYFDYQSLEGFQRPINLNLRVNEFNYLDERIFLPFLKGNIENTLDIMKNHFDCMDCRNYWIIKNPDILPRIYVDCSNKKNITDSTNFSNCS